MIKFLKIDNSCSLLCDKLSNEYVFINAVHVGYEGHCGFLMQVTIGKQVFNIADNFTLASPVINTQINGSQEIFQVSV